MNRETLYQKLLDAFQFVPTAGQATALQHLSAFLLSRKPNPTYILRGYAGTGKTTLVTTLVKTLPEIGFSYVLGVGLGWGAYGVWTAMVIDWICRIISFTVRYHRGKWVKLANLHA